MNRPWHEYALAILALYLVYRLFSTPAQHGGLLALPDTGNPFSTFITHNGKTFSTDVTVNNRTHTCVIDSGSSELVVPTNAPGPEDEMLSYGSQNVYVRWAHHPVRVGSADPVQNRTHVGLIVRAHGNDFNNDGIPETVVNVLGLSPPKTLGRASVFGGQPPVWAIDAREKPYQLWLNQWPDTLPSESAWPMMSEQQVFNNLKHASFYRVNFAMTWLPFSFQQHGKTLCNDPFAIIWDTGFTGLGLPRWLFNQYDPKAPYTATVDRTFAYQDTGHVVPLDKGHRVVIIGNLFMLGKAIGFDWRARTVKVVAGM